MLYKKLNLTLPEDLVHQVDIQAERDYSSRSEFIRKALVNQLRSEELLTSVLNRANAAARQIRDTSEQQIYDMITDADAKTCN